MANETNKNASRFPDDSAVQVWCPPWGADKDRSTRTWLPAWILRQCGPDEWHVVVEAPELVEPDTSVPYGDAPENRLYPAFFHDSSGIRAVTVWQWMRAQEGRGR